MLEEDHLIPVLLLCIVAVFLNLCLIVSIKNRKATLNVIDVLQICNTVLVILGLLTLTACSLLNCLTLDLHWTVLICYSINESLEYVFLHSICWTFFAVAVVRRKVCECRGRASVLVTKMYATKTYILCAIPVVTMVVILLVSTHRALDKIHPEFEMNVSSRRTLAEELFGATTPTFQLCHILLINLFPLLLGCLFYVRIYYVVRQAAQTMGNFLTQRNRNPSKVITVSVIVLLSSTMLTWLVYIVCATVVYRTNISDNVTMYVKIFIFLLYPLGEGLFLGSTKSALTQSNSVLTNRTRTRISPVMEEGSDMDDLAHPALKGIMTVTLSERDESNTSDCGSTSSINPLPTNDIQSELAVGDLTNPQPSTSDKYPEEIKTIDNRRFIKTSRSMDDIEEKTFGFKPFKDARHGSGVADYQSIQQNSPGRKKKKPRHTFEKMRSSRLALKYTGPPMSGLGRRMTMLPPGSPVQTSVGFFPNRVFENLSESPELIRKLQSPIVTSEGYSGLQYAKNLESDRTDRFNKSNLDEHQQSRKSRSRWSRLLPLMRNQSPPVCRKISVQTMVESEQNLQKSNKHSDLRHSASRQTSKTLHFDSHSSMPQEQTFDIVGPRAPAAKTRSISCVNNVYMGSKRYSGVKENKPKTRNKSVSFMSSIYIDDDHPVRTPDTVEVDSEINVKVAKGIRKTKSMEKAPSFDLGEMIKRKTSHWMLEKTTPRQECILKLQEINEYF